MFKSFRNLKVGREFKIKIKIKNYLVSKDEVEHALQTAFPSSQRSLAVVVVVAVDVVGIGIGVVVVVSVFRRRS